MKNLTKYALRGAVIGIAGTIIFCFCGCGSNSPTAEDILKKYEGYPEVGSLENGLGVSLQKDRRDDSYLPCFCFSSTSFSHLRDIENADEVVQNMKEILLSRLIAVDAENPEKPIEFVDFKLTHSLSDGSIEIRLEGKVDKNSFELLPNFILMGFKGIRKSESAKLETPAMFVILEFKKDRETRKELKYIFKKGRTVSFPAGVLTPKLFRAGNLFPADFPDAKFVEAKAKVPEIKEDYEGKMNLGGGNTLSVSFVVATKGKEKKIEQCGITFETHIKYTENTGRNIASAHYGYDIKVEPNGKFSKNTGDFFISGKIEKGRITGSIKKDGKSYSYSAK